MAVRIVSSVFRSGIPPRHVVKSANEQAERRSRPIRRPRRTGRIRPALVVCAAAALSGGAARAAEVTSTWFGQTGAWSTPQLWSNSNGTIVFPNNGNLGLTYDAVITAGTATLSQNITIDDLFLSGSGEVSSTDFILSLAKGGTWSGGELIGTGTTLVGTAATFNIGATGGGSQFLTDQRIVNQGTVNFNDSFAAQQSLVFLRTATITNAGTFNITADGHMTADGTGTFNNTGTLVKSGGGVALMDSSIAFNNSGTVNVIGGTLEIFGGGTETGSFNVGARTNYVVAGGTNVFQAASKITGTGTVFFQGGTTDIDGTYNVSNTIVRGASTTVNFNSLASTTSMGVEGGSVFVNNTLRAGTLSVSGGNLTVNFGGQVNAGTVTLNGGTTLVAPPQITILARPHAAAVPAVTGGPILSAITLNVISGTNTCGPGGTILVGSGGLIFSGNASPTLILDSGVANPGILQLQSDVTFAGTDGTAAILNSGPVPIAGTIDLLGGLRTFTVNDGAQPIDMQISARITNGALRKDGPGTLQLSGSSDYAGQTTLSGGVLEMDSTTALGAGGVVFAGGTLRLAIPSPATVNNALSAAPANSIGLDIGAGNYQLGQLTMGAALNVTGTGSIAFSGPISMPSSTTAVGPTTINSTANVTFSGPITGGIGLIKTLGSTLTFNGAGANTYGGATQVLGGTLVLSKPAGTVAVPGDLAIVGPSTVLLTASDQISPTSNVSFNATGGAPLLNLNGQNQTVGMINSIQIGAGTILLGGGTLTVGGSGVAGNFSGSLQGTGRLVKSGSGALTLGAANTFGGLTVGGGTLQTAADQHVNSLISTGGQLDVRGSQIFVTYPLVLFPPLNLDPAATIRSDLQAGTITSSLNTATTRVGLGDSADGAVAGLPLHTLVLRRTRLGDVNMDGVVNFSDLLLLAQNYGQTSRIWDQGDMNYDGVVNFPDLLSLAQNYGGTLSSAELSQLSPAMGADVRQAFAQVPEPGLALVGIGLLIGCRVRRTS